MEIDWEIHFKSEGKGCKPNEYICSPFKFDIVSIKQLCDRLIVDLVDDADLTEALKKDLKIMICRSIASVFSIYIQCRHGFVSCIFSDHKQSYFGSHCNF